MGELVKNISVVTYQNNYFLKFSSISFSLQKKVLNQLKINPIYNHFLFSKMPKSKKIKKQFCSYDISLEVLIGLVCRISFLGDIIQRNYPVPLPTVNEV